MSNARKLSKIVLGTEVKITSVDSELANNISAIKTRLDSDSTSIQASKTLIAANASGPAMSDSDLKVVADLRNDLDSEIIYVRNFNLSYTNYVYNATAGQTTFTGSDANSATLAYTVGSIQVFLNGVRLTAADFTATNGTSIVLTEAASVNNQLMILVPSFVSNYTAPSPPPTQIENSRYAVLNLSVNQDFDSEHNESVLSGGGMFPYSVFKDETGNTNPRPKHVDLSGSRFGAEYGSGTHTSHVHLNPYHSGGWAASFSKNTGWYIPSSDEVNQPGSGACTWEFWVFIRPQYHNRNTNNGSRRSIAITGSTSASLSGSPANNSWAIGIEGSSNTTGTGIYLRYRYSNTTYKKVWLPGGFDSEIERMRWHHVVIQRSSGTDGAGVYKCYFNGNTIGHDDYETFPADMNHTGRSYAWWGGYGGENGTASWGGGLKGHIMDYRLTQAAKYTETDGSIEDQIPTAPINKGAHTSLDSDVNVAFPWGPHMRPVSGQAEVGHGLQQTTGLNRLYRNYYPQRNTSGTSSSSTIQNSSITGMERVSPYDYDTSDTSNLGSVLMHPRANASRQNRTGISSDALNNGNVESIDAVGTGSDSGIDLDGAFTVEWWAMATADSRGSSSISEANEEMTMVDFRHNNSYGKPHVYYYSPNTSNNAIRIQYASQSYSYIEISSAKLQAGVWHHFALTRSSSNYLKFYMDGMRLDGTGAGYSVSTNFTGAAARPFWGASSRKMRTDNQSMGGNWMGYMTDCRVTVGTEVYTGQFNPPTGPLTTTGGTYADDTNVNTSIPSGHVKQLLQFKNSPLKDTVGRFPYIAPTTTDTDTGGLPSSILKNDGHGISNWPSTEASALGGGSTAGKTYLYFSGAYDGAGNYDNGKHAKQFIAFPADYRDLKPSTSKTGGYDGFEGDAGSTTTSMSNADDYRGFAMTWEAWIYPMYDTAGNARHTIFSSGSSGTNDGTFRFGIQQESSPGSASASGTQFGWVFDNGGSDVMMGNGNSYNTWYHIALVFGASIGLQHEWRLFVNGTRDSTNNITNSRNDKFMTGSILSIGSAYLNPGNPFQVPNSSPESIQAYHGIIRNFRIEQRAKYWDDNFTPEDFTDL